MFIYSNRALYNRHKAKSELKKMSIATTHQQSFLLRILWHFLHNSDFFIDFGSPEVREIISRP